MRKTSLAAAIAFTMCACSGGQGAPGADASSVLVRTATEPGGGRCPAGGVQVQTGVDDDRDAVLDDAEVDQTVHVCDGADGASVVPAVEPAGANCAQGGVRLATAAGATFVCNGAPGADGQAGQDGRSVTVTPEPAGAACASGGQRLQVGTGTPSYVCNGAPGADGQAGQDGQSVTVTPEGAGASCAHGGQRLQVGGGTPTFVCNGAPGANGQDGEDGQSVTVTPEGAGASCAHGGQRLQVGGGTPTFVCNGAPGANGQDGQSVTVTPEPAGAACAYGGQRLQLGTGTPSYVCNGAPGANGQDGQSVTVTPEGAGASCAHGGQRLQVGGGTPAYVCNGAPGEAGAAGDSVAMTPEPAGGNCAHGGQRLQVGSAAPVFVCNGAPGANGQDGESVTMTPEPPGPNCVFGGVALQVGAGPASYVCSGAPAGVTLPVVTTGEVAGADVRYVAAVVRATLVHDGGELVLVRGVVLASRAAPTLHDAVYVSPSPSSTFATLCDALAPDTTYFVRAFATNALGTSYGEERSFTTRALTVPALSTQPVSNVTPSTAISGGSLADDGGTPILGRGICWSVSANPTTAAACAAEGAGAGSFVALATGLASSTGYHVRAYATNAQGTGYGEDRTFTTAAEPLATVTTAAASSISYTTATAGGTVVGDAGAPVTSRGVCWATTPSPTTAGAKYAEAAGLGTFAAPMTGLAPNTTYYVRAFAVNAGGTSYGNEVSFRTLAPSVPSLTTKALSGIASYLAGSGGVISTDGGSAITEKGVCWSLNPGPTVANSRTNEGAGPSSFTSTLTGLNPLTTYYVRAYARNALGYAYGNELSFTTTDLVGAGPTAPVVGTSAAAIATGSTATGGGYVSNDGGSAVTARGLCWSTTPNPTTANGCSTDGGSGVGYFSATVTGLSGCGVVYYVRAFATNATGTGYGNQVTVSTGLLPTVTTADITGIGESGATSGGTVTDDGGCPITQKGVAWSWNTGPTVGNPRTTDGTGTAPFVSTITGLYGNRTYYLRAYATNSVGTAYGAQQVFTTLEPSGPYIGRNYAGGIVFYVDGSGQHGLVVTPSEIGSYGWGCGGTSVATGTAIGTGPANTAGIVAACGDNSAAKAADSLVLNGYGDWFLPSKDELALAWTNLAQQGLGGFNYGSYLWSSSQTGPSSAWVLQTWASSWTSLDRGYSLPARAVRAF